MILDVNTQFGPLRGVKSVVEGVSEFRGIPYAKPMTAEKRWEAPELPDYHSDTILCDSYGPIAMQPVREENDFYRKEFYTHRFHTYPPYMNEDCLYLNIWTPAKDETDKLPVFVWIHGGGFMQGYSHEPRTNGEVFASNNIVFVSINYRLGIFGFFSHPELSETQGGHSGNYAIMDQIMAIDWVRNNISEFGGDPENITVGGQSAGSYSVEALCVSPFTEGKIKRAIMQSGVITPQDKYGSFYVDKKTAEKAGLDFSSYTGKSLGELKTMPASELLKLSGSYTMACKTKFNYFVEDGCWFSENPLDGFINGKDHVSELLIGATSTESMLKPVDNEVTRDNYCHKIENDLHPEYKLMKDIRIVNDADAKKIYNMWFAWYQNNGSQALAEIVSKQSDKSAYAYCFKRELPGDDNPGSFHSSCIWYSFGNLHNASRPFTQYDLELESIMNGYWCNFIKTGDPNGEGLPDWPCFDDKRLSAIFGNEEVLIDDITKNRPDFFLLRDYIGKRMIDKTV